MKEWFLSSELLDIRGLPNSTNGIAQQARRHNWTSRKANGKGRSYEYHISNFSDDVVKQLKEKFTDTGGVQPLKSNVKDIKKVTDVEVTPIPVYNVYAACGFGSVVDSEYQIRTTYLPTETLKRFNVHVDQARIITCVGDSMETTLSDGEEVLVDISELTHPVKNGVYVIRIGDHVHIKRLKYNIVEESYDVISDNKEEYNPFTLTEAQMKNFAVIGKVVTVVMKAVF